MPIAMEKELTKAANRLSRSGKLKRKHGDSLDEAKNRFIFGTMRHKMNWKPSREK